MNNRAALPQTPTCALYIGPGIGLGSMGEHTHEHACATASACTPGIGLGSMGEHTHEHNACAYAQTPTLLQISYVPAPNLTDSNRVSLGLLYQP